MAGYCGYSMSNNAVAAYENGEMPKSKWTKDLMLSAVAEQIADLDADEAKEFNADLIERVKKCTISELRGLLLDDAGWHHTSEYFNKTSFYCVNIWNISDAALSAIESKRTEKAAEKSAQQQPEKIERNVSFLVWSGSRNHPKSTRYTERCEIKGNWAMTSYGKKSITGNGFRFLD